MDTKAQDLIGKVATALRGELKDLLQEGFDADDPKFRKAVMGALYRGVFPGKTRMKAAQVPRRTEGKQRGESPSSGTTRREQKIVSYVAQLPSKIREAPLLVLEDSRVGVQDNNTVSLFMEFQCDPRLFPYLVSSSRGGVIWVDQRNIRGRHLRAGVSEGYDLESFFRQVVREVAEVGFEAQWGNSHFLTHKGAQKAIDYVRGYEIPEVVLMVPPGTPLFPQKIPPRFYGSEVVPAGWLEPDCVIAVPKDRAFLGFVNGIKGKSYTAVLHNPSRGLAVASRWFEDGLQNMDAGDPERPHPDS